MITDAAAVGQTLAVMPTQGPTLTPGIGVVEAHGIGQSQTQIANLTFGIGAVLSLAFCLVMAARQKRMLPLYVFGGACLAVPIEIFVDVLGRCSWATLDQPIIGTVMGREVPLLLLTTYMFYFPVAVVSLHSALEKGMSLRTWWICAGTAILSAWLFELYPVHAKWWYYYGKGQPLMVLGLPMWWGPAAVLAVIGSASLTFTIRRHVLGDRHSWFMLFALPLGIISVHLSASFPVFVALSSTENAGITNAAALFTIILALCGLHVLGLFMTGGVGVRDAAIRAKPAFPPSPDAASLDEIVLCGARAARGVVRKWV